MKISRRGLGMLPVAAALAQAQEKRLASLAKPIESVPVRVNGENRSWQVLNGETHTGCPIDMHITELPPGGAPHAAHKHEHEEMVLVERGTMEITIEGTTTRIGPGGTAYVASNEMHGWRNVGEGRARYFVLALGRG